MKKYQKYIIFIFTVFALSYGSYVYQMDTEQSEMNTEQSEMDTKSLGFAENLEEENIVIQSETTEEISTQPNLNLYATSAVLMDADSNRILFEKNGYEIMPMASTTKIMTCMVTLENASLDEIVTVSDYASTMPDVQLNIRGGEEYYLKDLLYSLMLESHNDSAVAIAEHVGGTVEGFAAMMNEKAKELGCSDTYFITPNGLDATDERGIHSTTAADLSRILSYCIKKFEKREDFLNITRTSEYTFSDIGGSRTFTCHNRNAFLTMMEGALTGKTGFTSKAGYCYVGALEKDGKSFVVALLACGWPNNRTYKWSDTKQLMNYGLENYEFCSLEDVEIGEEKFQPILVHEGQTDRISEIAYTDVEIKEDVKGNGTMNKDTNGLLLRKNEQIEVEYEIEKELTAPVKAGQQIGNIKYMIQDEVLREDIIITENSVDKINYEWCVKKTFIKFLVSGIH